VIVPVAPAPLQPSGVRRGQNGVCRGPADMRSGGMAALFADDDADDVAGDADVQLTAPAARRTPPRTPMTGYVQLRLPEL
jgi:hypothetical protein